MEGEMTNCIMGTGMGRVIEIHTTALGLSSSLVCACGHLFCLPRPRRPNPRTSAARRAIRPEKTPQIYPGTSETPAWRGAAAPRRDFLGTAPRRDAG